MNAAANRMQSCRNRCPNEAGHIVIPIDSPRHPAQPVALASIAPAFGRPVLALAAWLCVLLLLILHADRVHAQNITIDPASTLEDSGTTFNWNHTVGNGNDRFLVVSMAIERDNDRVISATYAGHAMTFLGTSTDAGGNTRVEVWGLVAPTIGTNRVSVRLDGTAAIIGAAISFANVDQSNPISASQFASGTNVLTASASVASAPDEVVLAAISADDNVKTVTAASGQTSWWNRLNAADVIGAGSTKTGSATTTMSYTLNRIQGWAMGVFSVRPVQLPEIQVTLVSHILSDPVNGGINPKAVPGASIRYCMTVSNAGNGAATAVVATIPLPAPVTYIAGSMVSGTNCSTAGDAEDDNASGTDESDPRGGSVSGSTITAGISTLGSAEAMVLVFHALTN